MRKKIILHLGQSKTGTSSLQKYFSVNREELIKNGVLYPDVYRGGMALGVLEHNSFADSLAGGRRHPGYEPHIYMQQFMKQLEENHCHTMLLSGESFFGGYPQMWDLEQDDDYSHIYRKRIEVLRSLIDKNFEVHVVVYLRPQYDWLETTIAHTIRYEGLNSRKIYETDEQMSEVLHERMDYFTRLKQWNDVLSPDKISIFPYDTQFLKNANIIDDFLQRVLGAEIKRSEDAVVVKSKENKSLSRELVELRKFLNKKHSGKTEIRLSNLILSKMNEEIGSGEKYEISNALREKIFYDYKAGNQKLIDCFSLSSDDFSGFFNIKRRKIRDDEGVEILKQDVFIRAHKEFLKRRGKLKAHLLYCNLEIKRIIRYKMPVLHSCIKTLASYNKRQKAV